METRESGEFSARVLGVRLRAVRKQVGMSQEAVGKALGLNGSACHVYVGKLERGELPGVSFRTLLRYLQACKAPIGRFMLELAQSGAFGEAEGRISSTDYTDYTDRVRTETERRAQAQQRSQRRSEREAEDAAIIVKLWNEVQTAIYPLLPEDRPIFMAHYLEGVRAFYRAWKLATRGAVNRDTTLDVQMAFDRIEQAGVQRLVPAAVRKMREIVFERLMAMLPGAAG